MNLKIFLLSLGAVFLLSCGQKTEEITVVGQPGEDGISMGVEMTPGASACLAGGVTLKTYIDTNRNGTLDSAETVKQVSVVCNGMNGSNGTNGLDGTSTTITTATAVDCPAGGVILTAQGVSTPICNGMNGAMGPQGNQGLQGTQGPQGAPGQPGAMGPQGQPGAVGAVGPQGPMGVSGSIGNMTPVQLCPGDTGAFKEYGFVVGSDLFAVYFDKTKPIAFLAKLSPGNYVTTNGANCQFTYSNNGTVITLTSTSGTTTVPLTGPKQGLLCQVYDSRSIDRSSGLNTILTNATPKFEFVMNQLDVPDSQASAGFPKFTAAQQAMVGTEDYALDCAGYLNVPKSQTYNFNLLSDDGAKLYINNILLISMDQLQSPTSKNGSMFLLKGMNKINVLYFQGPLSQVALHLKWSAPEFSSTTVPTSVLSN